MVEIGTTQCKWDSVIPFDEMWDRLNKLIKPNGAIVLFGREPFTSELIHSNLKGYREKLTWIKHKPSNFACAKFMHLKYTEDIVIFAYMKPTFNKQMQPRKSERVKQLKKGNAKNWRSSRKDGNEISFQTDYEPRSWEVYDSEVKNPMDYIEIPAVASNSKEKTIHPTQKPVTLLEYLIKTYTDEGELVLDFTMGSGSTGVACMNTNRKFIGIELEEKYFDISVDRIFENYK